MTEIYLLRHAEKSDNGVLTATGEEAAVTLGHMLPIFDRVIASDSTRTQVTAKLTTGISPEVDSRVSFYMAPSQKSDDINELAKTKNISFLEAAGIYDDTEVNEGIGNKASELNGLMDELLRAHQDGRILIVSHDLSISPAMVRRGIELESIDFLQGYIISKTGVIRYQNV